MSDNCCGPTPAAALTPRYRKALWVALLVNSLMFFVEVAGSLRSGSSALLADAIDFAGDAANYGLSLAVLSLALVWRSRAAWIKGATMALFGLLVLGRTGWAALHGLLPETWMMGLVALLALAANAGVALLLYAFRDGDANMRSVWLCSRNDAIGNLAVILAAAGVALTGSRWPDLLVAVALALLALSSGVSIMRHARDELNSALPSAVQSCRSDPCGR